MHVDRLLEVVRHFGLEWFPADGSNVPFWFAARNVKYRTVMTGMCERFLSVTQNLVDNHDPIEISRYDWPVRDLLVLSVMVDQMPRIALAISYGNYADCDPKDVARAIDDSWSLTFARRLLNVVKIDQITDERLAGFYSLVFRHSNCFDDARWILTEFQSQCGLSPLVDKFLAETQKRQDLVQSSISPS